MFRGARKSNKRPKDQGRNLASPDFSEGSDTSSYIELPANAVRYTPHSVPQSVQQTGGAYPPSGAASLPSKAPRGRAVPPELQTHEALSSHPHMRKAPREGGAPDPRGNAAALQPIYDQKAAPRQPKPSKQSRYDDFDDDESEPPLQSIPYLPVSPHPRRKDKTQPAQAPAAEQQAHARAGRQPGHPQEYPQAPPAQQHQTRQHAQAAHQPAADQTAYIPYTKRVADPAQDTRAGQQHQQPQQLQQQQQQQRPAGSKKKGKAPPPVQTQYQSGEDTYTGSVSSEEEDLPPPPTHMSPRRTRRRSLPQDISDDLQEAIQHGNFYEVQDILREDVQNTYSIDPSFAQACRMKKHDIALALAAEVDDVPYSDSFYEVFQNAGWEDVAEVLIGRLNNRTTRKIIGDSECEPPFVQGVRRGYSASVLTRINIHPFEIVEYFPDGGSDSIRAKAKSSSLRPKVAALPAVVLLHRLGRNDVAHEMLETLCTDDRMVFMYCGAVPLQKFTGEERGGIDEAAKESQRWLSEVMGSGQGQVLSHPAMVHLSSVLWDRLVKWQVIRDVVLHALLVLYYTAACIALVSSSIPPGVPIALSLLALLTCLIGIVIELHDLFVTSLYRLAGVKIPMGAGGVGHSAASLQSVKASSTGPTLGLHLPENLTNVWNYYNLLCCVFAVLLLPPAMDPTLTPQLRDALGFGLVLVWFRSFQYLLMFQRLAVYIRVVIEVFRSALCFFALLAFVFLVYWMATFVTMHDFQDGGEFDTMGKGGVMLFLFLLGDTAYDPFIKTSAVSKMLFFSFAFLVVIFGLSFFVAQMAYSYSRISDRVMVDVNARRCANVAKAMRLASEIKIKTTLDEVLGRDWAQPHAHEVSETYKTAEEVLVETRCDIMRLETDLRVSRARERVLESEVDYLRDTLDSLPEQMRGAFNQKPPQQGAGAGGKKGGFLRKK